LKQAMVVAEQGWRTMPGMNETALTAETVPVAVIIQRTALDNPWVSEKWEAHGIVYDERPAGGGRAPHHRGPRDVPQVLYPGFRLRLQRDEAEGYYLNMTSPAPKVSVLWRWQDGRPRPALVTVSYGEGALLLRSNAV
jgi:hypothetical protein